MSTLIRPPQRVQRRMTAEWRAPLDPQGRPPLYVGRPGKYGNPFKVGGAIPDLPSIYGDLAGVQNATAGQVVEVYRRWMSGHFVPIKPSARPHRGIYTYGIETLHRQAQRELAGRDLMCWCKTTDPCHADVLLRAAGGELHG